MEYLYIILIFASIVLIYKTYKSYKYLFFNKNKYMTSFNDFKKYLKRKKYFFYLTIFKIFLLFVMFITFYLHMPNDNKYLEDNLNDDQNLIVDTINDIGINTEIYKTNFRKITENGIDADSIRKYEYDKALKESIDTQEALKK